MKIPVNTQSATPPTLPEGFQHETRPVSLLHYGSLWGPVRLHFWQQRIHLDNERADVHNLEYALSEFNFNHRSRDYDGGNRPRCGT